jgi:hypothetical protein
MMMKSEHNGMMRNENVEGRFLSVSRQCRRLAVSLHHSLSALPVVIGVARSAYPRDAVI